MINLAPKKTRLSISIIWYRSRQSVSVETNLQRALQSHDQIGINTCLDLLLPDLITWTRTIRLISKFSTSTCHVYGLMAYSGAECHSGGLLGLLKSLVLPFLASAARFCVSSWSGVFRDHCVSSSPGLSNTSLRASRASSRHRDMEHHEYGKFALCRVKKAASSL